MKLTNVACKNALPKVKPYKLNDGGGLFLLVQPGGSKLWRLKYYFLGKEKSLSIGAYPFVSLAEAREERDAAKKQLLKNIDPAELRKENKRIAIRNANNTFKIVALEWIELNKDRWSNGYERKVMKALKKNVFPCIGNRPIANITTFELITDCLKKIENRSALHVLKHVRQVCGQIFRYGIQTGRCAVNPVENLRGALKPPATHHFRTMELTELPKFLKALERNEARIYESTRRAVWLSLYTFCRPVEIRTCQQSHINFEKGLWIIPRDQMKMKRDHVVPLSKQAIAIIQKQIEDIEYLKTDWIFPNIVSHKKPMSDGTVNKAIQRLGYGEFMVAHGFRALARTIIREELDYDSEIIERQLAHNPKNPLGAAYDRTQFLKQRTIMMQDWADYLDSLRNRAALSLTQSN
jgi:integrase